MYRETGNMLPKRKQRKTSNEEEASVFSKDTGRSKECRESDLVIEADVMILEC